MKLKPIMSVMALIFCSSLLGYGQNGINEPLANYLTDNSTMRWMWMNAEYRTSSTELWGLIKSSNEIDPRSEFAANGTQCDHLNWCHTKYKHVVEGIKVEGSEYIFHHREQIVKKANGILVTGIFQQVDPVITAKKACVLAYQSIFAFEYDWDYTLPGGAETFPSWELVLSKPSQTSAWIASNFNLAYKVKVKTEKPHGGWFVYIDAVSGERLKTVPFILECVAGTGNTLYNGTQAINTEGRGFPYNDYHLKDDCRENFIQTFRRPERFNLRVYDSDNNWASQNRAEVSIHWAAGMTYDYFLAAHGRKSIDNDGRRIKLIYREDDNYNPLGASWNSDKDKGYFGSGDGTSAMVSLDVVGHEITHGVVHYTSELEYAGESGALNESFADIFGTCIEHYAVGLFGPANTEDWTLGEDVATGSIRSMDDPQLFNQPEFFLGQDWFPITSNCDQFNDNCGVHINSGVQNLWFFLLSEGGTVTDAQLPNGSIRVCGIGMQDAARIAYRNLRFNLTKNAGYQDARIGAIQAAEDLFGIGSFQADQCVNAWHAVGVGGMVAECPVVDLQDSHLPQPMAVSISPNPITEYSRIIIEAQRPVILEFEVFNLKGIQIATSQSPLRISHQGLHEIPFVIPELAAGVYLVKFKSQGETILKKILVP